MKQMKQVHNIIINEAMKLIDRNEFVDQLVKKHPQLKKVEADLRYSVASMIYSKKIKLYTNTQQSNRLDLSKQEVETLHKILINDPIVKQQFSISDLFYGKDDWDAIVSFNISTKEYQDKCDEEERNRKSKRNKYAKKDQKINVKRLDVDAKINYTKDQLYDAALKAGHELFDQHASGLIWGADDPQIDRQNARIEPTNTYKRTIEMVDALGDDALEAETATHITTFEFVFFPSQNASSDADSNGMHNAFLVSGLDAADMGSWLLETEQLTDTDGYIYSCDNSSGDVVILVFNPTFTDKETYMRVVGDWLAKNNGMH
jgi:hypothetical protein